MRNAKPIIDLPNDPPAGPMFRPRFMYGYVGMSLLTPIIPVALGMEAAAAAAKLGFDAFIDSFFFAIAFGFLLAAVLGVSLRGRRQPLALLSVLGRIFLVLYGFAVVGYGLVRLSPNMIVNRDLVVLADFGAVCLVLFAPAAFFIWRMIRDPALRRIA